MNNEQLARYSKNIFLPPIDLDGQEALFASKVMIIGLGGIGSICASYLAASGVGTLYLADDDKIDITNLQRQITYQEKHIGQHKAKQTEKNLQLLNHEIIIHTLPNYNQSSQARTHLKQINLIIDCADNFQTRFLINDDAYQAKIYHIMAAAIGFNAQITTFDHPHSACYNCLYDKLSALENPFSEQCSDSGILGPLVGLVGTLAAIEAIKILAGIGAELINTLLSIDALSMNFEKRPFEKDSDCQTCQTK